MFNFDSLILLDEGAGGGAGGQQQQTQQKSDGQQSGQQQTKEPVTYDAWLASQPADVKSLVDGHIGGLKTALGSERERNKTLEKDLREAASKAEKGSDSEKRLTDLANQAQQAGRKNAFYEGAVTAGVKNLKLAYIAAASDDLFKKDGSADFEALKKGYPELFGQPASNNAGSGGDGNGQAEKKSMDSFIRARIKGGG